MEKPNRIQISENFEAIVEDYELDRASLYQERDRQDAKNNKYVPGVTNQLRHRYVLVPEIIYRASGIMIREKRIKSFLFTTDVAIIRNNNAGAVLAVYPFTPEATIMQATVQSASVPVFCGIGGGTTSGLRSAMLGFHAEILGAYGVVVNAPISNKDIQLITNHIDIPLIATVVSERDDYMGKIKAGAQILNISAGKDTVRLVSLIRSKVGEKFPIIATGGHKEVHIKQTIEAGANAISYTPPTSSEILHAIMEDYRREAGK